MLPAESTARFGGVVPPGSLERLCGAEKVIPPSIERLKNTVLYPGLSSHQTTFMLPLESTATCCTQELPGSFEIFCGGEKTVTAGPAATTWAVAAKDVIIKARSANRQKRIADFSKDPESDIWWPFTQGNCVDDDQFL